MKQERVRQGDTQEGSVAARDFAPLALDQSPDGVFVLNTGGRFVYVNEAFCSSLGYTRGELSGMSVRDIDADSSRANDRWTRDGLAGAPAFECRFRAKSGAEVPLWIPRSLELEGSGGLCCVYARSVGDAGGADVGLLKRSQEQLRRTRAIREITLAVSSTLDLPVVLHTLFEKIDLLPYPAAVLRLYNQATGQLECMGCHNLDEEGWKTDTQGLQRGLTKEVFEAGQILVSEDVRNAPYLANPHLLVKYGFVSFLGLPLVARGIKLGVLAFFTKTRHVFTDDEIEFLSLIGAQAAVAIHNSQLYAETKEKAAQLAAANQQLSALYEITATVNESLDLDSVLQQVIREITEIFQFDTTRVFLFDGKMQELTLRAGFEREAALWPRVQSFRTGEGIVGRVAETGEARVYEDVNRDPDYLSRTRSGNVVISKHAFFAVFPIKSRSQTWGTIVCIGREPRRLSAEEFQLITSMANQIGIAVENANLFEETRGRAEQLSMLYSLATVLNQTLDVEATLRGAMHRILEMFAFDAARLYVLREDSQELELLVKEGLPDDLEVPTRYEPGKGCVGHVFASGVPRFFEDVRSDPLFATLVAGSALVQAGYICQFFIPIRVKGNSIGVINIASREIHRFGEREEELMDAIANQVGVAVENSNLFAAIREKARELEGLNVELHEANRIKTDFVNAMSHELRTPLTASIGYISLLLDGYGGALTKTQAEALENVNHQSQLLLKLINDILTLGQLEAGRMALSSTEASLDETFRHVRAYAAQLDQQRRPQLRWEIEEGLPALRTDHVKLEEILQNLIGNAYKFTSEGEVTVRVRNLNADKRLEFVVEDTGIGIEQSEVDHIFDAFHQSADAHTGSLGGVGLGLNIVKRYLELMQGEIHVESLPGRGSRFIFTLPHSI